MRKFNGFTPQQQAKLLGKMGYKGSVQQDDMNKFLSANPEAALKMGKYAEMAQKRLDRFKPNKQVAFESGGLTEKQEAAIDQVPEGAGQTVVRDTLTNFFTNKDDPNSVYDALENKIIKNQSIITGLQEELSKYEEGSPEYADIQNRIDSRTVTLKDLESQQLTAKQQIVADTASTERELLNTSLTDPASLVTKAEQAEIDKKDGQFIDKSTGKIGTTRTMDAATVKNTATAELPSGVTPAEYEAAKAAVEVGEITEATLAAQGVKPEAIEAAKGNPEAMAALSLEAAQTTAAQVEAVNPRELQPGEAISGSAVDMAVAEAALQIEAAQADPSKKATVAGQLEGLMADFEGGETPTWAAGAMRAANEMLQSRGLGASSVAGQAVIQAAMEAAVPIASADARTHAQFEMTNLTNRQQATMFAAQERARFLGQKFDQEFQTKVLNAAKISQIANMNFTAEQQVALENARLANTVNIANLNAKNAKVLADAAAMSQMDLANLSNEQQAKVQNSKNFLEMDLANLSNEQQTTLFKSQSMVNAILSDQAADNAAKQFNAASQNQINTFMADLASTVQRFNAQQANDIAKFNKTSINSAREFNKTMRAERDQFNAANSLLIAQANAKWRQDIATTEFDAEHEINMQTAKNINGMTTAQLDVLWQRERDLMAFAFQAAENQADRDTKVLLGDKQYAIEEDKAKGALTFKIIDKIFGWF